MQPEALTIAVLMDSMDWFTPTGPEADAQVKALRRSLKSGGRVLLRSAGLEPWYIRSFEQNGFSCKRVAARVPEGTCTGERLPKVECWAKTLTMPIL